MASRCGCLFLYHLSVLEGVRIISKILTGTVIDGGRSIMGTGNYDRRHSSCSRGMGRRVFTDFLLQFYFVLLCQQTRPSQQLLLEVIQHLKGNAISLIGVLIC
jgi:hypothetical protein